MQSFGVLHDGRLDLVEPVRRGSAADDGEDALAPGLLGGRKSRMPRGGLSEGTRTFFQQPGERPCAAGAASGSAPLSCPSVEQVEVDARRVRAALQRLRLVDPDREVHAQAVGVVAQEVLVVGRDDHLVARVEVAPPRERW